MSYRHVVTTKRKSIKFEKFFFYDYFKVTTFCNDQLNRERVTIHRKKAFYASGRHFKTNR